MTEQTILIIEDEPAIADNIRFALETEGFETCWQAIGMDAFTLFSPTDSWVIFGPATWKAWKRCW